MIRFIAREDHPSNWNRDERNLYIRVFSEFLFAFGEGTEQRESILFQCQNRLVGCADLVPSNIPRPEGNLIVTFDNNLHDVALNVSHGPEYGDIVIWGDTGFVTIETKCNTDWQLGKDIEQCFKSGISAASSTGRLHMAHVLLVAERKWSNVQFRVNQKGSQYKSLIEWLSNNPSQASRLCVVTWEQIAKEAKKLDKDVAGAFSDWLLLQVKICLRESSAMPPSA